MPTSPRSTPFRILIIDDDADVRELLVELLEVAGHVVVQADSGEAGCTRALSEPPDLILVDYNMPGLNGVETVQRLKQSPQTRTIPVVGMTGSLGTEYRVLVEAGCVGYIPKPVDPATLARVVGDFLDATVARRRPPPASGTS